MSGILNNIWSGGNKSIKLRFLGDQKKRRVDVISVPPSAGGLQIKNKERTNSSLFAE